VTDDDYDNDNNNNDGGGDEDYDYDYDEFSNSCPASALQSCWYFCNLLHVPPFLVLIFHAHLTQLSSFLLIIKLLLIIT
jgi:hypothetical protein